MELTLEVSKGLLEDILAEVLLENFDNIVTLSSTYQRVKSIDGKLDIEEKELIEKVINEFLGYIKVSSPEQGELLSRALQRVASVNLYHEHHYNQHKGGSVNC